MPGWERIGFAVLRGGVKAIPVVGGVVEEVLRCLDEERAAALEGAQGSFVAVTGTLEPGAEPSTAALGEIEQLATSAWSQVPKEEQRVLKRDAALLAQEDDPLERRALAKSLAQRLSSGLLKTGTLGAKVASASKGAADKADPAIGPIGPLVKGAVIGDRYRLDRELNRGGMGAVWIAWDLKFNCERALKIAASTGEAHENFKARFAREARLGDLLGSRTGVVRAFDWGSSRTG